jgi:hypothetical protein
VETRDADAVAWASTMFDLGLAWSARIAGYRKRNIELARACYASSLHIFTPEAHSPRFIKVSRQLSHTLLCLEYCDEADQCAAAARIALKEVKHDCDRGLVYARSLSEEYAALYETLVFCRAFKDDTWVPYPCARKAWRRICQIFSQPAVSLVETSPAN